MLIIVYNIIKDNRGRLLLALDNDSRVLLIR